MKGRRQFTFGNGLMTGVTEDGLGYEVWVKMHEMGDQVRLGLDGWIGDRRFFYEEEDILNPVNGHDLPLKVPDAYDVSEMFKRIG